MSLRVGTGADAYFEDPDDPEGSRADWKKQYQARLSETRAWVYDQLREKYGEVPRVLQVGAEFFVYRGADGRDWYQDILDGQGERTFANFPVEWDAATSSPRGATA